MESELTLLRDVQEEEKKKTKKLRAKDVKREQRSACDVVHADAAGGPGSCNAAVDTDVPAEHIPSWLVEGVEVSILLHGLLSRSGQEIAHGLRKRLSPPRRIVLHFGQA